jgi:excisionase family DNA binding protein
VVRFVGMTTQSHDTAEAEGPGSFTGWDTRRSLAEKLDVSLRTVDLWRQEGVIPYLKIGSLIRFDFRDVMSTLRERYAVRAKPRTVR